MTTACSVQVCVCKCDESDCFSVLFFYFCTLIFDCTNPDCVCVFFSFALAAQGPPDITDPSQVDSTPLGG